MQTTKYFAPETVQMLQDRLAQGQAGLQAGDTVSYIIQFTPIPNGASSGAGGYITDYVPAGAEVVGAWFVRPDGAGGFFNVSPPQAATMSDGWGPRGQEAFNGNWTTTDTATTTACSTAGYTLANCTARLSELHADTGIFYSTDPRTTVYTSGAADGRVRQGGAIDGGNGYIVTPTAQGQLNPLLNQTVATTHNLWDAAMTNAFGSSAIPGSAPRATNPSTGNGTGAGPFNANSAVAGPDTGYKLDYTGMVGPWKRIYYPGSRVGTNANGPATGAGTNTIAGTLTSAGWNVSPSNPLPANTNAVRWAAGRLTVGTLNYVKISMRLTTAPPADGLVNNSEVFGGDASADEPGRGKDNVWRYHVPSVADNNSNLYILKTVVGACSGASLAAAQACTPVAPSDGGAIIPDQIVKLRYRILYLNSGNGTQYNVRLTDQLPYLAGDVKAIGAGNVYVLSGPDIRSATTTSAGTLSNNPAAVGAARGAAPALTSLLATGSQQTATFAAIPTLAGGGGGALELDVVIGRENGNAATPLDPGAIVSNRAVLTSNQINPGVTSSATSTVSDAAFLAVSKTTSTPAIAAGGTATYTITVTNTGNAPASAIVVRDMLPYTGTAADATRRFSYTGTAGAPGTGTTYAGSTPAGTPTIALSVPPTLNGYTGNANQQQITWTFPAGSTLAVGASFTMTFSAVAGTAMPASETAYRNDVLVNYDNGPVNSISTSIQTAPVLLVSPLTITKTIDCVYNAALTACNAYTGGGTVPTSARVRYKLHYENTSGSAATNVYICDQISSSQASPAFATTISVPSIAPTPAGPYLPAPNIGTPAQIAPASGAATTCGYSGANTYAYPVIASLAAGASGDVYFDLATNAANNAVLGNTGKIANPAGSATSNVTATARTLANLVINKTTSTPTLGLNGTATYTITVTNTGNSAAGNIRIYDFLPYTGVAADATRRFNYVATSSISGLTSVTPTTAVPPVLAPNSSNVNQQQVLWDFGAVQTLAPGATATIVFTAQAGSAIPAGATVYGNDLQVKFTDGAAGTTVNTVALTYAALLTIPATLVMTKSIDCVYSGAVCTAGSYVAGSGVPVNAKIRYKLAYSNPTGAAINTIRICDELPTQIAAASATNVNNFAGTGTFPAAGQTFPAAAGCGLTGSNNFSFTNTMNLAAGASGTVLYDVQTNAAQGALVTNTGKLITSTQAVTSSVSTSVGVPNIVINKSASPTSVARGGTVVYTMTIRNTGAAATSTLQVYDFLPFSGVIADATRRFSYDGTYTPTFNYSGTPTPGSNPAAATVVAPTVSPYSGNANQQQVRWDFGNYALSPGGTITITFRAGVGSNTTLQTYANTGYAEYTSPTGSGNASAVAALVTVVPGAAVLTKAWSAAEILQGASANLIFTLTNSVGSPALSGIAFTDTLPASLRFTSATPTITYSSGCSGSSVVTVGTPDVIAFSGVAITNGTASCAITINGVTNRIGATNASCAANPAAFTNAAGSLSGLANLTNSVTPQCLLVSNTQPTLTKSFSATNVAPTFDVVLTLTLGNGNGIPLTGAAFTDTYPAGVVNSPTPAGSSTCGGTVTAAAGGNTVTLSGGTIPANGTCLVTVNVRGTAVGSYVNTVPVGGLTADYGFASTVAATAPFEVLPLSLAPGVNKTFSVSPIPQNGTSVLSIVVNNPNPSTTLTNVAVSDTYPAGLVNRTAGPAANAAVTCTAGSTATLTGGTNGGNTLGMTGGSILPLGTCTVTVNVTSATAASYANTTGAVSATGSMAGGTASATLVVNQQPTVAKVFAPTSVAINADSVLTLTLTNPNNVAMAGADFTDTYPVGLVSSPAPAGATTCGGTVTAAPGGNTLALAGGTIPANGSCTVTVNVRSAASGSYLNTLPIGGLTASNGYSNAAATSATLTVGILPPTISKSFVTPISTGDISRLTFTIDNPNPSTALSGILLTDVFPTSPAAMTVANPLATGNTCGGTLQDSGGGALANGDAGIRITGAALAAGASCTFFVDVTAGTNGTYTNTTQAITSTQSGAGGTATAPMVMQAGAVAPTVTKTFSQDDLGMHGVTTLTLTFTNPNNGTTLQRLRISDTYPAGLVNAPTPNITNGCGGNTTAGGDIFGGVAGGNTFGLQGNNNSLAANSSCSISIRVTSSTASPPTSGATITNNSGQPNACTAIGGLGIPGSHCYNLTPFLTAGVEVTGNADTAQITFRRPTIAKAISPSSIGAGGTAAMTITLANPSGVAMPNATFTDAFPGGMTVAAPLTTGNSCGGTLNDSGNAALAAGDVGVRLNGGSIPAGGSCIITVNVTAAAAGSYTNTIAADALSASGNTTTNGSSATNAAPASAVLTVRNRPTITKAFSPVSIGTGTSSTLTLTLSNNNATAATGISFTDTYPAGLVNTTGVVGGTCAGVVSTAIIGGGTLNVTDGVIPGGSPGTCTITIGVTGPAGTYNNTAGGVTTNETPDGPGAGSNTATLDIRNRPTIAKAFNAATIAAGQTSTMTFTLSNYNATAASGITFTDTYPAGIVNAAPLTVGGTCAGITSTAAAGGGTFNVTAGSIPGGAPGTCTITVLVTASTVGTYDNTTSGVTSTQSGPVPGPVSNTATLTVSSPVTVVKSSSVISDPLNGTNNPKRIPGAVIQYTVTVNYGGAVPMTNVVISDLPPAGTSYVPGSLVAGGTAEDDDNTGADETNPNGGDYGQTVPGGITLRIGTIPAGGSDNGRFRVQIQ